MTKIIIDGDICPINRNESYFKKGDAKNFFNDLLPEFKYADFSIINLECLIFQPDCGIREFKMKGEKRKDFWKKYRNVLELLKILNMLKNNGGNFVKVTGMMIISNY